MRLIKLVRAQHDGNLFYNPPQFFQDSVFYLPFRFNCTWIGGTLHVYVAGLSHHAASFGCAAPRRRTGCSRPQP